MFFRKGISHGQGERVSNEEISQEVRAFIAEHIESVVQLEVLLLLYKNPQQDWTADDIGRELRIDPAWASEQLANLCARGLLICPAAPQPIYRYGPRTPELDRAITDLDKAYTEMRVTVVSLIFSKPVEKIRIFADAFRLRKD